MSKDTTTTAKEQQEWRTRSVEDRLAYALIEGVVDYIVEDTEV